MAKNRLVVNHVGDSIQLSWQRGQAMSRFAPAVPFEHPFNEETLGELRWYLEEYLRFPYGIEPEKAAQVEQKFQVWGQQLFELVFRSSEKAREFFQEATRERLEYCEIGITSDDPSVLNLPWELLYSPDYQFLAPSLAGMYRSLNNFAVRAELEALPQHKLNILLVIARPYGERDVSLKTIARPMLEALKPIRQQVSLKVLRPPSFDEFQRELNAHKGFYHIVHFDGHGNFDPKSQGFQHSFGSAGQGVLVFEQLDGSPQVITAAQIAQNLRDCDVPIFILNACKSAQAGSGSFSSVATQLVSLGAKGVVAMAYSVYADAARHFIGRLYEQLIRGVSLDRAVADGRKEVLNKPLRPSPKGKLRLADWIVPVLYQQETHAPFMPADSDTIPDLDQFLDEPAATNLVELPEEGSYGFVGRDYDILRLERAFRQNRIVLLQGIGGVGKTDLACGFARWLDETQGRAQIFFLSFEHGAGLSHVINQVGRTVWQDKFSQYSFEQQQAAVLKYLKTKPCLLIWDNFEPVAGFPTGNEPLLLDDERDELRRFLKNLRDGVSWVLITSRREERWLDCGYTLVHLQGLSHPDAEEFAAQILQRVGVDRAKLPPEYLDLLKLLGGHPLSLRVVLPHLKTQSPTQLIEALRQGFDTFQEIEEEGKDKSLTVSLDYSFSKLSERARRHLPFLALFNHRVTAATLGNFSSVFDFSMQIYENFFRETLTKEEWIKLLDEAVSAGILEFLDQGAYGIHPTLPWYLRKQLVKQFANQEIDVLEQKLLWVYLIHATAFNPDENNDLQQINVALIFEESNLLKNLRFAEQEENWGAAWIMLSALGPLYNRLGLWSKFRALRKQIYRKIGMTLAETLSKGEDAAELYVFLKNADSYEAVRLGNHLEAMQLNKELLNALKENQYIGDESAMIKKTAIVTLNLGLAEMELRDFTNAENHFDEALGLYKHINDDREIAHVNSVFGRLYTLQGNWDKAIESFQNCLVFSSRSDDSYLAAQAYYELGNLAYEQRNLTRAFEYLHRALNLLEQFGDVYRIAACHDLLGHVLGALGNYRLAKKHFQFSLQIYENENDLHNASDEYHGLGKVARFQGDLDDSIAYLSKALELRQDIGEWYKVAATLVELGRTFEIGGHPVDALKAFIRALLIDISDDHSEELINENFNNLGRILKLVEENQFRMIWREVVGEECPEGIYLAIQAASENQEE